MRVNFFVIAAPGLLESYPASYLTSFYLSSDKAGFGDELVRAFPNILVIDTGAVISEVKGIIAKVSQTISAIFIFTLLSGLLVLYAALLSTEDERSHEAAIVRTLGAGSAYLTRLHLFEFAAIGLLSGLFSAGSAVLLGFLLASRVLDIPYRTGMTVWMVGALGGTVLVLLAGWLNTKRLAKVPPMLVLREE
jgi:putative ABC transport system permease protein